MILAIDFDGTIVKNAWPDIGPLRFGAKTVLQWLNQRGHTLVLWTCREGQAMYRAANFAARQTGVVFQYINENDPKRTLQYNNDSRKIGADWCFDDKAGFLGWWSVPIIVLWLEWREKAHEHRINRQIRQRKDNRC